MQDYKRILLKISGEGLSDQKNDSLLDSKLILNLAKEIKSLVAKNIEIAVVVGAGNIFRGKEFENFGLSPTTADNMGMLATIFNCLAIADIFKSIDLETEIFSAIELNKFTEFYNVDKAKNSLSQKKVVILAGGIANPFFTTDTTAVVRGAELNCDMVFKATQVDGIFDKDPKTNSDAKMLSKITFDQVINNNLNVMDLQSIIIAKNTNTKICIFNMHQESALTKVLNNSCKFSVISKD
ncbi:UMP kinase [Rickettsiales bacterium LUAb2]